MATATDQLRSVSRFAGTPDRQVEAIEAMTRAASYEPGTDLVREDAGRKGLD